VIESEVDALSRAHQLFAGSTRHPRLDARAADCVEPQANDGRNLGAGHSAYHHAARRSRLALHSAARTDAAAAAVIADAHHDRVQARERTKNVLDEARADAAVARLTPLAQREALRRRVGRLRAQRAHVLSAQLQAGRHRAALRALRYRLLHQHGTNGRAGIAVRAALSRLGHPYVWGATGPDQFDCSGLVQWSYAQAGIHLSRTTYQQINDGIPVPRSQVRPGDLVFPHAGHVQLAIGNNLVVEAPYSGASVRISPLGSNVAIRRPL
jgi:cell wall-associated NlpC family hydrolase